MKKVKQIVAILLVCCMMITLLPANTFAHPGENSQNDTTQIEADAESDIQTLSDASTESMELTAAMEEAKNFIDGLTVNSSSNVPATVVTNDSKFFSWDNEKRSSSNKDYLFEWSYYNGVVFEGLDYIYDALAQENPDAAVTYYNYVKSYLSSMITDGALNSYAGYVNYHGADCYKTASLLLDYGYTDVAATLYQDLKNAQSSYTSSDRGGNYNHTWKTASKYNLWLDGLYMIQPFMAEYASYTNDTTELDAIADRFTWIGNNMYDSNTGLYYHAANSSSEYYNNENQYWGRAIGWYAAAMTDVMDYMTGENLEGMKYQLKVVVDGMLPYQDTDTGMWRQFVNVSGSSVETSATALMAYAIQKAVNNGWLDSSYSAYAKKAFIGMCEKALDDSGLHYICFKGSTSGYSDVSYNTYVNEGKGVGPFIMAYAVMLNAEDDAEEPEVTPTPEPDASDELIHESTGIVVSSSAASAIHVTEVTDNETIVKTLKDVFTNYVAYDITLEDYTQGTEATVKLPMPEGATADNVAVYYVSETGTLEEMAGQVDETGKYYVFATKHFSVYTIGVKVTGETENGSVSGTGTLVGGTVYTLDKDGVDAGKEYLIVNTNNGTGYALTNKNGNVEKTEVSISEDTIIVTDDTNIAWKISGVSGTIENNGKYVYPNRNNLSLNEDQATLTVTDQGNGAYQIIRQGRNTYYLIYNKSWTGSKNSRDVYLYKYTNSSSGEKVVFTVTPETTILKTGSIALNPAVTVADENIDLSGCTIDWVSDNESVATVNGGTVTAVSDGTANITATLSMVNGTKLQENIVLTIPITVQSKTITDGVLTGNTSVTTKQNIEPDFSNIKLKVTYDDGTTGTITVDSGLIIEGYDITTIGYSYATISYAGEEYGTVRVTVEGNPYEDAKGAATDYPEYPANGAVRVDKTATANAEAFKNTGVTHVELDVAGISVKRAVDVILVTDLSNSMAWKAGSRTDATSHETTKLYDLKQSVASFADIFLAADDEGNSTENTMSLVTFGGYDADYTKKVYTDYADSTQTLVLGSSDASVVKNKVNNIMLLADDSLNVGTSTTGYYLSFDGGTTYGENYGNTNYDHAFMETADAIAKLKAEYKEKNNIEYDASGRQIYVLFMTDGAPSNYNGVYYNHKTGDRADVNCTWMNSNGSKTTYTMGNNSAQYSADTWYQYIAGGTYDSTTDSIPGNSLYWADQVYNTTGVAEIYNIGFDLDNGGFSSMTFTLKDGRPLSKVLEKLVKDTTLEVFSADDETGLTQIYADLATKIRYAGTSAQVTDIIDNDFTLQMSSTSGSGEKTADLGSNRTITVTTYDLWTKTETTDTALIGTRKGTSEVIETVTFTDNGTEAYSDRVNNSSKNILENAGDGTVVIEAHYFTYTKTPEGVETFKWTIGNITDKEIALGFDVYLKGSLEGECEEGIYYTNENATLEYIDINGYHATQIFPVPAVSWGGATTTIRFYLVNEKGEPVNHAGEVVPWANRVYVGDPVVVSLNLNADITIPAQEIQAATYVPAEYFLYDRNASYTVQTASGENNSITGGITVSEPSEDASKTTTDNLGNKIEQTGAQTTKVINNEETYYTWSTVGFGVRWDLSSEEVNKALNGDQVVIDYGKAIQIDVLANDAECIADGFSPKLVGFVSYNANTNLRLIQVSAGTETYTSDAGSYSVVDGKVQFQLSKMLSSVQKVFCVVKLTEKENKENYYYLYEELDIIPATIMYYETDFADGVFTMTTTGSEWSKATVAGDIVADGPQDDGTIGQNLYGYDSSYTNDMYLSNGSSYKVEGQGIKLNESTADYTQAQFSFTGTGFDIISRTGAEQGAIRVDIYGDAARTNRVKSITVLNKSESNLELYQIPVVSAEMDSYGTYYVTIGVNAAYTNETYPRLNRGGEFFFDAVRVYNPISSTDSNITLVNNAYVADGEANAEIKEVRNILIDDEKSLDGSEAETEDEGVVFVDRVSRTDAEGNIIEDGVGLADYSMIGPNNEVYLVGNQAIGFGIEVDLNNLPTSIDIGAKSVHGEKAAMNVSVFVGNSDEAAVNFPKEINSGTAQFFDILNKNALSDLLGEENTIYVIIDNQGEGILSITDLKIAYGNGTSKARIIANNTVLEKTVETVEERLNLEEADDYDILSATFTTEKVKRKATVTLEVTTSDAVESLKVQNSAGRDEKITVKSVVSEDGIKTWTLQFKVSSTGTQTYTVTGYGTDGSSGASADATIKVTR